VWRRQGRKFPPLGGATFRTHRPFGSPPHRPRRFLPTAAGRGGSEADRPGLAPEPPAKQRRAYGSPLGGPKYCDRQGVASSSGYELKRQHAGWHMNHPGSDGGHHVTCLTNAEGWVLAPPSPWRVPTRPDQHGYHSGFTSRVGRACSGCTRSPTTATAAALRSLQQVRVHPRNNVRDGRG
jgi:hypothetical protein